MYSKYDPNINILPTDLALESQPYIRRRRLDTWGLSILTYRRPLSHEEIITLMNVKLHQSGKICGVVSMI
jgi:hypothetical protein